VILGFFWFGLWIGYAIGRCVSKTYAAIVVWILLAVEVVVLFAPRIAQ
jgi:hypothetical protein